MDNNPKLIALRKEIDDIDHQLLSLLSRRKEVIAKVAAIKMSSGQPARDQSRESALISERQAVAAQLGLNADFVEAFFQMILSESRAQQAHQGLR